MIHWIFFLILIQLIAVSWIDIKTRKISNLWVLLNGLIGLGFHIILKDTYPIGWATLYFPLGWLAGGFILFLLGIMGAGDSKYLASLFLLVPVNLQDDLFEKLILSTCVVGFVMLTFKILRDFKTIKAYALSSYWVGLKKRIKSHFSYAPVILFAWVMLGVEQW